MTFSTRNSFYLRISKKTVLPTYVYLDERHVNWMSDTILQHVLSDLRPHILSKLRGEADVVLGATSTKKPSVDTHRGDAYQFCYFIRKTEPHSVVVKSRNFCAANLEEKRPAKIAELPEPKHKKGKRKENPQNGSPGKQTRSKKQRINAIEDAIEPDDDIYMSNVQDVVEDPGPCEIADDDAPNPVMDLEVLEEEEKPKPVLALKYQGFSIYGHCLCIVVEPWPVIRTMTGVAAALARMTPGPSASNPAPRGKDLGPSEPLFLPEEVEEDSGSSTKENTSQRSGRYVNKTFLDQVLNSVDESDDDDVGGMMEFSQALRSIGDLRAGAINDDDDIDGSVLFGDADEYKEL